MTQISGGKEQKNLRTASTDEASRTGKTKLFAVGINALTDQSEPTDIIGNVDDIVGINMSRTDKCINAITLNGHVSQTKALVQGKCLWAQTQAGNEADIEASNAREEAKCTDKTIMQDLSHRSNRLP